MENVKLLFSCITHDMMEPVGYLPWGLCAGCLYLLALKIWRRFRRTSTDRSTLTHDIIRFLLVVYCITLLKLAFFSREPGSRTTVSTHLFDTWGTTMQAHAFFIENILMFNPLAFSFPLHFRECAGLCGVLPPLLRAVFCWKACSSLPEEDSVSWTILLQTRLGL